MKKVRFSEPGAGQYLCCFNSDVFWVLCDCIYNMAKQVVDVTLKNIQKYENVCKVIVEKNTSVEKTRASFFKQNRHWIVTALSKVFYMHLSDWKMNCAVDVILIPRNQYTINHSVIFEWEFVCSWVTPTALFAQFLSKEAVLNSAVLIS